MPAQLAASAGLLGPTPSPIAMPMPLPAPAR